ncbi:MAG: hypothetical protein KatS3mg017_0584 [Fimbriimonadales bacterium]|nr:MAG: hypothetical protein KatS3mg017_0584 [Fimbriimonadales bacterium]
MKRTLVSLIAAITLLSTAHVQPYRDDFDGGFALNWSWKLPQNDPLCTLFDNAVSFGSSSMTISTRDGGMFEGNNSHKNVPTLRIVGDVPEDWYIEVVFRTDWSQVPPDYFTQAGLVIAEDATRYFQVLITRTPSFIGDPATVYGSTNAEGTPAAENPDQFRWGERVTNAWTPDSDWMGVRIERIPSEVNIIRVSFRHSGTNGWVPYDGFNGSDYIQGDWGGDFYNHIVNLVAPGARIGIYTDNACGCGNQIPFEFDYFETNIPVALVGDVNTDGIVDDADLLAVLFNFGTEGECQDEDVNNDGVVDDADLLAVLFNFGSGG